ncbi:MAG: GNAT family N-acetyltransferase [Blautia massiliensis (ex Durand et al. 2017)]|nr:MAG: hypothetical protein DBX91_07690 [Subdoligranulum variabile]
MICSVTGPAQRQEFDRRIAGRPYFEATMGTHCALFGAHPASGWQFCLLPGTAALTLRGGTATVCGSLPEGQEGADAREELAGFLRFLGVDRLVAERPLCLPGWQAAEPLLLWELPQGRALPLPPAPPPELRLAERPPMQPVSRLVFPESRDEQDAFYSLACTALAHGRGCCRALLAGEKPVCTVGSYEQSQTEAYMAAGVTAPEWRGRGLASWLIVRLANELAAARTARFACAPALGPFYERLGFAAAGTLLQFTRK